MPHINRCSIIFSHARIVWDQPLGHSLLSRSASLHIRQKMASGAKMLPQDGHTCDGAGHGWSNVVAIEDIEDINDEKPWNFIFFFGWLYRCFIDLSLWLMIDDVVYVRVYIYMQTRFLHISIYLHILYVWNILEIACAIHFAAFW